MQATLPVRTYSPRWFAGLALALAVAIFVAAALVLSVARPGTPAVDAVSQQQAAEQALIQHRAGERESLVTNSTTDRVLIDHRGGVPESLYASEGVQRTPAGSARDDGLGSSINSPSGTGGGSSSGNGNPGMKPR